MDDVVGRPGGTPKIQSAQASRLVVVSAGAFGSPSILERSGIGAQAILKEHNVKQLVDLPGVGENYMGKKTDYNATLLEHVSRPQFTLYSIHRQQ